MTKKIDTANPDIAVFTRKLNEFKQLIDADISTYSRQITKNTRKQYGPYAQIEIDAFLSILGRGGKRIRGALVMLGYEMSGGTNKAMIIEAARVVEMIHAYILIIDDIQDRSRIRRGGPAAHMLLSEYHSQHSLSSNSDHFGISIAMNSALAGAHAAQMLLTNLDVDQQLRLNTIAILNRTMLVTAHGQTNDIMNEVLAEVSQKDIETVLEWKTAHYTFLNPLHMGMVLAGADCDATDAISNYAIHAGKAFQITDDILGVFGNEFESGKSPLDDIREGKRTVLTVNALENTDDGNKNFLIQMLGNDHLTRAEFDRCKDIIIEAGSLDYAKKRAIHHINQAVESLDGVDYWSEDGLAFLRGLAVSLLNRHS